MEVLAITLIALIGILGVVFCWALLLDQRRSARFNAKMSEYYRGLAKQYSKQKLMKKPRFEVGEIALRANRSVEPMRWVVFTVNETYLPLIEQNPADYKKIRKPKTV